MYRNRRNGKKLTSGGGGPIDLTPNGAYLRGPSRTSLSLFQNIAFSTQVSGNDSRLIHDTFSIIYIYIYIYFGINLFNLLHLTHVLHIFDFHGELSYNSLKISILLYF